MPEFGVLIIKNPGPNTEVEQQGLGGHTDEETDTPQKCLEIKKAAEAEGHKAWVVVAWEGDEGDGLQQIELVDQEYLEKAEMLDEQEKDPAPDPDPICVPTMAGSCFTCGERGNDCQCRKEEP